MTIEILLLQRKEKKVSALQSHELQFHKIAISTCCSGQIIPHYFDSLITHHLSASILYVIIYLKEKVNIFLIYETTQLINDIFIIYDYKIEIKVFSHEC